MDMCLPSRSPRASAQTDQGDAVCLMADLGQVFSKEEMSPGRNWMDFKQRQKGIESRDRELHRLEKLFCFQTSNKKSSRQ